MQEPMTDTQFALAVLALFITAIVGVLVIWWAGCA